ncbi:MAG: FtsX-like permease family protein, partial [Candidatus Heimdallarchaeota archaeon]
MKLLEQVKFFYKMLNLNRKNTIVIFLGLGISLAIISEGLIFMYSFQYDAFSNFNKTPPTKQLTVSIDFFDVTDVRETIIFTIKNATQRAIEDAGMVDRVRRVDIITERGGILYLSSNNPAGDDQLISGLSLFGLPVDYYSAFESLLYNGSLPYRTNEALAVVKRSVIENTNLSKLGLFPLYVPVFVKMPPSVWDSVELGIPEAGNYINITGVVASEDFENYLGPLKEDMRALDDYLTDQFLITKYDGLFNFINRINYDKGFAGFKCRFAFDLRKIDAFNVGGEIKNLQQLGQELARVFDELDLPAQIDLDLVDRLYEFNEEFVIFQLFGLLFITPIIGMALSLTNYSTHLMKKRQKRHISNMLQRGSSRKEVLTLLTFQVVEYTIMAILICFVIGYPFAWLMIRSSGFLAFSGTSLFPAINLIIFFTIIATAFIFSTIINAKSIWEMSNISTEEAYGTTIQKKPTWQKMFLDVILIVIGVSLWIVVKLQLKGLATYSFAYGFGTTAPVCLILGSILFVTRIYPYFIKLLGKIGWKRSRLGILGLAAKRSLRRRNAVIRSLVLISLTFTLIISSMTTISSYKNYDAEQAYYSLGADILVRNVKVSTDTIKEQVLGVEGVEAGTYVRFTSQLVSYGSVLYSYLVVGIDPEEFVKVAHFEKNYFDGKPEAFFDRIQSPSEVLMQKDEARQVGVVDDSKIVLWVEKSGTGLIGLNLTVVGQYNYFPRFFMNYPREGSTVYRFSVIGNYNLTEAVAYNQFSVVGDLLVKVAPGYSITTVARNIELTLGRSVDNIEDLMKTSGDSLRNTMLYGSLNTSFISSLVIIVAALSLMIIIQSIENEMEVVMLKTLGMSPKQLFSLFTYEALSIVLFGSVLGAAIGIFSAKMFLEILTIDYTLPPVRLIIPQWQFALAFVLLFSIALAAAALTSWIIFRKDTIKGIKQL